ncbi:seminal plasma protein HSP-1-like [Arapaima gigas]
MRRRRCSQKPLCSAGSAPLLKIPDQVGARLAASWQTKAIEQDVSPDYCVFPFKYKGQWFYSCTAVDAKRERKWCSLTSNYDQDRLWGHCLGDINYRTPMTKPSCVFPFIAGGKTYHYCTTDYWLPGITWCATTANYDKDKKWVYCHTSGSVFMVPAQGSECPALRLAEELETRGQRPPVQLADGWMDGSFDF